MNTRANKSPLLAEIQNHVNRRLYLTPYSNTLKDGRLRTKLYGYKGTRMMITRLATVLRKLGWTKVSVEWVTHPHITVIHSVTIRAVPPTTESEAEVDKLFNDVKVNGGYPPSVKAQEDVCAGTFVVVRYNDAADSIAMLLNDAPYNSKRPQAREHTLQIFTVARNKVGAVVTQPSSDGGVRALIGDEYITQTQIVEVLDGRSAAFVKLFE